MCWVMPPSSLSTTLDDRSASSRVVLPWSTWPMMVTTGAPRAGALVGAVEVALLLQLDLLLEADQHGLDAQLAGDLLRQLDVEHVVDGGHHAAVEEDA